VTVSILIVNWNGRDALARTLAALAAHAASPDIETIVVDNASRDGSVEMVRRDFPGVRLVAEPSNLGFAGGVNLARRQARGRHLLLLNPDAEPKPDAVRRLSAALDAEPSVGAVAGRLVDAGGHAQAGFNVRRLPTIPSLACDLLLVSHVWPRNPVSSRYYARDLDLDAPADVEQPAAAALMVQAAAFDDLGGFDEQFHPAWWEDVDFCRRLLATGRRIRFEPAAVFVHAGGHTLRHMTRDEFLGVYYANLRRYVHKHHGPLARAFMRVVVPAGHFLRRLAPR
jgi:GT2 family glycosyltransferase